MTKFIDFNNLATGTVVDNEFQSEGVTISAVGGSCKAMIFDTAHPTGGDHDLETTNLGKALIISEDGDRNDPDDNASGGTITFAFESLVFINRLTFLDIEEGASVRFFAANGDLIKTVHIDETDNNGQLIQDFDVAGVARMDVTLNGSGAIDNLVFDDAGAGGLDGVVEGDNDGNLIDAAYDQDPDGDVIDAGDAQLPGEGPDDDIVDALGGDDTIESGAGDDDVYAGSGCDSVDGGAGDDLIFGDSIYAGPGAGVSVRESFEWVDAGFANDEDITDFIQNTGNVDVTFSIIRETGDADSEFSKDKQNIANIDDAGTTPNYKSSLQSILNGKGNDADYALDFSAPVEDVSFRINDIDGDGVVQVSAFDADGNPIVVNLEGGDRLTLKDKDGVPGNDTADSNGGYLPDTSSEYSLLVSIPGPVSRIVIEHDQNGSNNSGINVTDVYFDAPIIDAGMPGDDTLNGGIGDDTIFGEDGDDVITGGAGSDSILGGDGDDSITSSDPANDLLVDKGYPGLFPGEEGTPAAENERDFVDGGAGNDTISTGDDRDTIVGGTGDDVIDGGIDDDEITGDDGADRIVGGEGNDEIDGGDGDDTIYAGNDPDLGLDALNIEDDGSNPFGPDLRPDNGRDTVFGGEGNDLIFGADDDDELFGEEGDDTILGEIDGDLIDGGEGNDVLGGGQGDDTIAGGDGIDIIVGGTGDDDLDGGADTDLILGGEGEDVIAGGDGVDILDGEAGDDTIDGGADTDLVIGEAGDDSLIGGGGQDVVVGGIGNDTLFGDGNVGEGNTGDGAADFLFAGEGDDSLIGGSGNDTIDGGAGADFQSGGDDRDTFIEIGPGDTIVGGEGGDDFDTIVVSSTSLVEFDPNDPEAGTVTFYDFGSITPTGTATFSQIENVVFVEDNPNPAPPEDAPDSDDDLDDVVPVVPTSISIPSDPLPGPGVVDGTDGPDSIGPGFVDADGDEVDGADGLDDTILAFDGDDTVDAGLGDDEVLAGDGDDSVEGGEGNDVLRGEDGDDTVLGGSGNDQLAGDDGVDELFGGDGNDILEGGDGDALLDGGDGKDFIIGGDGDDTVFGGEDSDFIVGGEGDDSISVADTDGAADIVFAGDDADTIFGGGANDTIIGGEGGDDNDTLDLSGSGPLTINFDGGDPNSESGTVDFLDDDGNVTGTLTFAEIENVIPCFTPGTLIATASGERLVEELNVGDRVITRDNGIQEIRWVGRRDMSGGELARAAHLRPVLIRQGALGNGLPERDMLVSPQHRVLMSSDKTALYFEESEVLVPAKHLTDMDGIDVVDVSHTTYIHVMFDQHEVILSDGTWTESFQPGDQTLNAMDEGVRAEILELFPELETETGIRAYAAARRSLKKHEAKLLTQ